VRAPYRGGDATGKCEAEFVSQSVVGSFRIGRVGSTFGHALWLPRNRIIVTAGSDATMLGKGHGLMGGAFGGGLRGLGLLRCGFGALEALLQLRVFRRTAGRKRKQACHQHGTAERK
jgi:hypothetical protein